MPSRITVVQLEIHRALDLFVLFAPTCHHRNRHGEGDCQVAITNDSDFASWRITEELARQSTTYARQCEVRPSHRHGPTLIETLYSLATLVLCPQHSDVRSVTDRVCTWLSVAASSSDLFALEFEFRASLHDYKAILVSLGPVLRVSDLTARRMVEFLSRTAPRELDREGFLQLYRCDQGNSPQYATALPSPPLSPSMTSVTLHSSTDDTSTQNCPVCLGPLPEASRSRPSQSPDDSTGVHICPHCRQIFCTTCANNWIIHQLFQYSDPSCPLCRGAWRAVIDGDLIDDQEHISIFPFQNYTQTDFDNESESNFSDTDYNDYDDYDEDNGDGDDDNDNYDDDDDDDDQSSGTLTE